MAKIDLETLASGYLSTSNLNNNFQAIEDEFNNKVLYRNPPAGENNAMLANIDFNSFRAINAADAINSADYVTLSQLNARVSGTVYRVVETQLGSEADVTNKFTLLVVNYVAGSNNLDVYRNGQRLRKNIDYTETSNTEVTLTFNPNDTDGFDFITNTTTSSATPTADNVVHLPAGAGASPTDVQTKLREFETRIAALEAFHP